MKINATNLRSALESSESLNLIDVRTPAEFGEVHIEGSRLMSLDRLDAGEVKRLGAESCVLVCRSGKRAEDARRRLEAAGCEGMAVLDGGVSAWEAAGFPVRRGREVMSLERQVRVCAGLLVVLGVVLGSFVNRWFYGISGFVGCGLVFAGLTDWCGMGMLLARMPWNQRGGCEGGCGSH